MWAMPNVMPALPNIGGALCKSSVIPFLVPRRKVWLTSAAGVPCSNAANIGERKTCTKSEFCTEQNAVTGQEPPKVYIYTSPGDGKTWCKVWLASGAGGERRRWTRCTNEAKTRNPLNLLGCPKLDNRCQPLVGRSSPYCEEMWKRYCC